MYYQMTGGVFNINIDSTGSSTGVYATVTITRDNLPDNLKFYLDENYKEELTRKIFEILKSDSMTKTIPVYWFWDGSVDDENDSLFINALLSANINVSVELAKPLPTLYETLTAKQSTLDTNVNFGEVSSSTNGQGLMMVNSTQSDTYPILYYRGDVADNNVIYGDYCWLIVRTTETGGVKLIYNGEVNEDGSCNNYSGVGGTVDFVGTPYIYDGVSIAFNTKGDSPVYVGYMYNDTNTYFAHSDGWVDDDYFDTLGTLDVSGYKAHLANDTIDSETGHHIQNKYDSTIKGAIDEWYKTNIEGKTFENLLEDTVWCNDRSVHKTYSIENYEQYLQFHFGAEAGIYENSPSLVCPRDMDKFTVNKINGNGDLTYPIATLTAVEILMSGTKIGTYVDYDAGTTPYLTGINSYFNSMSPGYFSTGGALFFIVEGGGMDTMSLYDNLSGVRPSVSLGINATITGGNGSFETPYRVDNIIK